MFDDQTEVRHGRHDKKLWKAAAAVAEKQLSSWIRDTLNTEAKRTLTEPTP